MKHVVVTLALVTALAIAGPANAQTVSCGQVITANTRVANDLINCPGTGLVIVADSITLDLNGHLIDGLGPLDREVLFSGIDNTSGHDRGLSRTAPSAISTFPSGSPTRAATG
jgi:hypothetical protein